MPHPVFPNNYKIHSKFGPYIDKIGLEVEGGWICQDGYRGGNLAANGQSIVFDRSVRFRRRARNPQEAALDDTFVAGEINSPAYSNFNEIGQFLNLYWPDQTNASCGFHVHASFKSEVYYNALMHNDFYTLFKSELSQIEQKLKLGAITKRRIAGKNRFCKDEWNPERQKRAEEKYHPYRYAMINFCWNVHRTVEVRVFSSHIQMEKSFHLVKWWVDIINRFLETQITPEVIEQEQARVVPARRRRFATTFEPMPAPEEEVTAPMQEPILSPYASPDMQLDREETDERDLSYDLSEILQSIAQRQQRAANPAENIGDYMCNFGDAVVNTSMQIPA
jgi:hypothetical protein